MTAIGTVTIVVSGRSVLRWSIEIGLAIVAAIIVGYFGGRLLALAQERGWTSDVSEQIGILALALLAYLGSVAVGGNGFVAAFAGGILFGAATIRRGVCSVSHRMRHDVPNIEAS